MHLDTARGQCAASVERVGVSRMRDFSYLIFCFTTTIKVLLLTKNSQQKYFTEAKKIAYIVGHNTFLKCKNANMFNLGITLNKKSKIAQIRCWHKKSCYVPCFAFSSQLFNR